MTKELTTTVNTPIRLSDTMTGKLPYTLANDGLFHIVLQKEPQILKSLLCSLLDLSPEEIIDIHLENPIYPGDYMGDKEIILDVILTLNYNHKINIELQIINRGNWPERSLFYLCTSFADLNQGDDYRTVKPAMHIGILNYTLFKKHPKFYSKFLFQDIENSTIFSDKLALNVLDLSQIDLATKEDISSGRWLWAKLLKATKWEEIRMLTKNDELLDTLSEVMAQVMSDKELRLRFEARKRYELDQRYEKNQRERDRIAREQAQAEKEQAQAEKEQAQAEKEQAQAEKEQAQAEKEQAQAEKEQAQAELAQAQIKMAQARSEGKNELLSLIQKMTENSEGELLPKLNDSAFLEEMYQKYQIVDMN